jgi:hypothetical protein
MKYFSLSLLLIGALTQQAYAASCPASEGLMEKLNNYSTWKTMTDNLWSFPAEVAGYVGGETAIYANSYDSECIPKDEEFWYGWYVPICTLATSSTVTRSLSFLLSSLGAIPEPPI